MQLIQIGGPLLLLTLLTACSSKSSSDELTKELQTVTSWAATAHMVGDAWMHGNVPTVYAKQTLKTAQEELEKERDKLSKPSIAPSQRRTVLEQLKRLQDTVGQMSTTVEHKDRTGMSQKIQQLSTQQQTISKLEKMAIGQP